MEQLTLLPEVTPANRSALQESKRRRRMTVISGLKCIESLEYFAPVGSFVRTFMATSDWAWTKCLATWSLSTTPQSRWIFRLSVTVAPITGEEFLLWPTPSASDKIPARSEAAMIRQMTEQRKGRTKISTLKDAAVYGLDWTGEATRLGNGELNPQLSEWMMGYPIDWTELPQSGTQ